MRPIHSINVPTDAMFAEDFKLITKARAADIFGVDVKTIDNRINAGKLPAPTRWGSKEYWHPADFEAFLDRTFRAAPVSVDGTTTVTATPAAGPATPSAGATSSGVAESGGITNPKANARGKDTNPVVRQQARGKALLDQLNAAD